MYPSIQFIYPTTLTLRRGPIATLKITQDERDKYLVVNLDNHETSFIIAHFEHEKSHPHPRR